MVTFDDSASKTVKGTRPVDGTFKPMESLSVFNGKSPFGEWKFYFADSSSND